MERQPSSGRKWASGSIPRSPTASTYSVRRAFPRLQLLSEHGLLQAHSPLRRSRGPGYSSVGFYRLGRVDQASTIGVGIGDGRAAQMTITARAGDSSAVRL